MQAIASLKWYQAPDEASPPRWYSRIRGLSYCPARRLHLDHDVVVAMASALLGRLQLLGCLRPAAFTCAAEAFKQACELISPFGLLSLSRLHKQHKQQSSDDTFAPDWTVCVYTSMCECVCVLPCVYVRSSRPEQRCVMASPLVAAQGLTPHQLACKLESVDTGAGAALLLLPQYSRQYLVDGRDKPVTVMSHHPQPGISLSGSPWEASPLSSPQITLRQCMSTTTDHRSLSCRAATRR